MLKAIKLENTVFFLHHLAGFRKHYIHCCQDCTFRLHGPSEGAQERLKSRSFSNSKCSGEHGQKVSVLLRGAISLKFTGSLEGCKPLPFLQLAELPTELSPISQITGISQLTEQTGH